MQILILIILVVIGGSDIGGSSDLLTSEVRVVDYSGDYDCSEASDYSGVNECI